MTAHQVTLFEQARRALKTATLTLHDGDTNQPSIEPTTLRSMQLQRLFLAKQFVGAVEAMLLPA